MALRRWTVRQVRRLGLAAGMAALLLQVVAWGWMPSVMGADRGSIRAGEAAALLICTSDGLKSVLVDGTAAAPGDLAGTGQKPSPRGTDHAAGHCPLCPLMAGLALPPPPVTVGPTPAAERESRLLFGERIAAGWFLSTLQARAPPTVA